MTRASKLNPKKLVNRIIAGWYPRHNFHGIPTTYEERIARITAVRLISKKPLDPETFLRNPLQRRGKVLLTCIDLVKDEERHFYLDSFRNFTLYSET